MVYHYLAIGYPGKYFRLLVTFFNPGFYANGLDAY